MEISAKRIGPRVRVALLLAFCAVWLVLCAIAYKSFGFFREGGWGMWPILGAALAFIIISVERTRYLYFRVRGNQKALAARVQKHILRGDLSSAVDTCDRSRAPLGRIVGAGLRQLHRPDVEVQEAIDEAALLELPRVEARTGYLAMIGNIATLLGLLGTIVGLITSFAGVSLENEQDPATQARAVNYVYLVPDCEGLSAAPLVSCIKQNKATILARGISEAMHCTAFGLGVGILSLLAFSILNGRTQRQLDQISSGAVHSVNLALVHRQLLSAGAKKG